MVFKESESDGQEFVVDTLRNFEPVQGMEVGSDVVVLRNSADDPSEVVLDVLKASELVGREIEVEGVAVVKLGVNN